MRKIVVISDWAHDSLACQEFRTALYGYAKVAVDLKLSFVLSQQSAVHAGFLISQVATTDERYASPTETVIFVDVQEAEYDTPDEVKLDPPFLVAKLTSGLHVCGLQRGLEYSFIHKRIDECWSFSEPQTDFSPVPYRDSHARLVAHIADYMEDELDLEEVHTARIPQILVNMFYVLRHDHRGVVTTSLTHEDVSEHSKSGDQVVLSLGGKSHTFTYSDHASSAMMRPWHLYPGASGDPKNPYMDLLGDPSSRLDVVPGDKVILN
ncbi:MAG: hypothetical protein WCJ70_03875 [bacterium]